MARHLVNPPPDPTFDPRGKSRKEIRQEFGNRLAAELAKREWSQSDLARLVFDQTHAVGPGARGRDIISAYVLGHSLPTPPHLKLICDALGVPQEDLLPGGLTMAEVPTVVGHAWRIIYEQLDDKRARLGIPMQEMSVDKAMRIMQVFQEPDSAD